MGKMDQIDRIIAKYQNLASFLGEVQEERIAAAEKKLNVCFPEDYRRFLKKYGAGSFGGFEIYGIVPKEEKRSIPNGIWLTEDLREKDKMPEHYAAIGFDGFGNYYCIETKKKRNEEAPIVIFVCDPNEELFDESEVVADSFSEFLLTALKTEIDFLI